MFDDFRKDPEAERSRKRLRGSMAAAAVIYGSVGAFLVAATATARKVVEEELTQVEFAPPPEPEPPPPEPPPVQAQPKQASPRPKAKRPELKPPDEIPDEKPKESEGPLSEAGPSGPVDGFLDGVEGSTGTAKPAPPPPPKAAPLTKPVGINTTEKPPYPKAALRKGIEGTVTVSFIVLENGTVTNVKAISGPEELREAAVKLVSKWRFKPAKRGSTPVRYPMTQRITYRVDDA